MRVADLEPETIASCTSFIWKASDDDAQEFDTEEYTLHNVVL